MSSACMRFPNVNTLFSMEAKFRRAWKYVLISNIRSPVWLTHALLESVWGEKQFATKTAGRPAPELAGSLGSPIPRLSEPWYCCAEPTDQQLQSF